jgi:hypothetical protein
LAATTAGLALLFSSVAPAAATQKPPAYASRGPFAAGVTTLSLPDRLVEVYRRAREP